MSHVPERKTEVTFQPYAECADKGCGWETAQSAIARQKAKDHVRYTGHQVRVVIERVALWAPK